MKDNNATNIEVMTDFALEIEDKSTFINVLIKHDYYSTDNDNGRLLLDSFLDGLILISDKISNIIVVDSAVKLLDTSDKLNTLITLADNTFICSDSIDYYNVVTTELNNSRIHIIPRSDITDQIIYLKPDIIIE